jgi:hypothetical protein
LDADIDGGGGRDGMQSNMHGQKGKEKKKEWGFGPL